MNKCSIDVDYEETHSKDILLINAKLIDGTGMNQVEGVSVFIKDGMITSVHSTKSKEENQMVLSENTRVIDLEGMTILPGVINTHVHIDFKDYNYLKEWLYSGITTVRDMGILSDVTVEEALEIRNTNMDSLHYPRVIMCGKFLTAPGGYGGSSPIHIHLRVKRRVEWKNCLRAVAVS